jgi:hypothetical protein
LVESQVRPLLIKERVTGMGESKIYGMEFCQQEAIKTLKKLPKTIKVYAFR